MFVINDKQGVFHNLENFIYLKMYYGIVFLPTLHIHYVSPVMKRTDDLDLHSIDVSLVSELDFESQ